MKTRRRGQAQKKEEEDTDEEESDSDESEREYDGKEETTDSKVNLQEKYSPKADDHPIRAWATPRYYDDGPATRAQMHYSGSRAQSQGIGILQSIKRNGVGTAQSQQEELAFQISKGRDKEEFAELFQLRVFLVMHKMGKIGMIHSISRYSKRGSEYNGKYVAFMGDFTTHGGVPYPILLPTQKAWDVYQATISTDAGAYITECREEPELKSKLWEGIDMKSTRSTPHMLHIPLTLVQTLVEKGGNLSPYDVVNIVYEKYHDELTGRWENGWDKVAEWCLMAAQKNKLAIEVEVITDQDDHFARWRQQRLQCTLGGSKEDEVEQVDSSKHNHQGKEKQSLSEMAEAMAKGVVAAILQQGIMPQSQPIANVGKGSGESKDLDEDERALLMGFSSVYFACDLQPFWQTVKVSKPGTIRRVIATAMSDFAYKNHIHIDATMHLDDDNIKDIIALRFSPGPVATFETAQKGLSPFNCRSRSIQETQYLTEVEIAKEQSKHTRTFDECIKKSKYKPRFPETFAEMRLMLDTYMVFVWVLFGNKCPLYIQLKQVSTILNDRQVQLSALAYTKAHCFRIVWAIVDESRRYLDQGLTARAFNDPGNVIFPVPMISSLLSEIRIGTKLDRASYPNELKSAESNTGGVGGGGGGGGAGAGTGGGTGGGGGGSNGKNRKKGDESRDNQGWRGGDNNHNKDWARWGNENRGGGYQGGGSDWRGGWSNEGGGDWRRGPYQGGGGVQPYQEGRRYEGAQGLKNKKIEEMMKGYLDRIRGSVRPFDILGVCNLRLTDLPEFRDKEGRLCIGTVHSPKLQVQGGGWAPRISTRCVCKRGMQSTSAMHYCHSTKRRTPGKES